MPTPSHAESSKARIEERIRLAELQLMAREERLWRGASLLRTSVQERLNPRRLLPSAGVLAGTAAVLTLGWWLLQGSSTGRSASVRRSAPGQFRKSLASLAGIASAVPWVAFVNVVWPLLPSGWRRFVAPGIVGTGLSMAVPWVARWLTPREANRTQPTGQR
jgi:hypothetical protein